MGGAEGRAVRARSVLIGLLALLAMGVGAGGQLGEVTRAASAVLGPAHDASAGSDVRALGIALQSYALVEGDLGDVTAAELVDWGWTSSPTTTVQVWVDGERFLVRARDVRAGSSTLQVSSEDLAVRALPSVHAWPDAADGDLPVEFVVTPGRLPQG